MGRTGHVYDPGVAKEASEHPEADRDCCVRERRLGELSAEWGGAAWAPVLMAFPMFQNMVFSNHHPHSIPQALGLTAGLL